MFVIGKMLLGCDRHQKRRSMPDCSDDVSTTARCITIQQKFNIEQACCGQAHWITKRQFWENMKGWGHILWNSGTLLRSLHVCSLQCANRNRKICVAFTIYTTDLLMTVFSRSNRHVLPSRLDSGIRTNCRASSILRRVTSLFIYRSCHNCTLLQMDYELGNV